MSLRDPEPHTPPAIMGLLELFMLGVGLRALIGGTLSVGGGREATGIGARIAGLILVAPFPVALVLIFDYVQDADQTQVAFNYFDSGFFLVEWGLILGCGFVGFMLGAVIASSQRGGGELYSTRELRESRGNLDLPVMDNASLPSVRKGAQRRPPRQRKQERLDEPEVVDEVDEVEEVGEGTAPARRPRKRPARYEDEDDYEEDDFRPRRGSRRVLLILAICIPLVLIVGGLVLFLVLRNVSSLREYEFGEPGRRFRVRMPKGASEETKEVFGRRSRTVEVKQKNGLHYFLKEQEVQSRPGLDDKQRWLDGLRSLYPQEGLKVTSETRTLWDSDNPGRLLEGNVTDSEKRFRARVWLVDDRFYFLIVRGPAGKIKSADVTRFLDSLELLFHARAR